MQEITKSTDEKYKILQEQVVQLSLLIEEVLTLNTTMKYDVLLYKVMASATKLMKAEGSSLMLLDENTGELVFEIVLGEKKSSLNKLRIKAGEGIAGWVLKEGVPLLVPDASKDFRFSSKIDESIGFKTKSILCVPLKIDNKVIGVVEVINRIEGEAFSQEDVKLFTAFANIAAVSIQNSKIYSNLQALFLKEAQNQLDRLDVMSHVSGITLSPMDFSNLFKAMLEIVIQSLEAEAGVIFLFSEERDDIIPIAFRGFDEGALLEKNKLKICEQIAREIVQTQKPLKVEGFIDHSINHGEKVPEEETRVVIGIPIRAKQIVVGIIVVFSRKGEDISHQDIEFLKEFSSQIGLSFDKIDVNQLFGKHKIRTYKIDSFTTKGEEYRLQLETLSEAIEAALVITDMDFNIQFINKKAELIFGIVSQNLKGQNCINCHSVSLHDNVKKTKTRFLEDKNLNKVTFRKKIRSENKIVNASIFPIRDAFSNVSGFLMLMKEIRPRKKYERKK